MDIVRINKGTTALTLKCNAGGQIINCLTVSIFPFLKKHLIEYEWDYRFKVNKPKYFYFKFDRGSDTLYLPVNILKYLESYFNYNGVVYEINELQPNDTIFIHTNNISTFIDREEQTDAIKFLTNGPGMKALELQTGKGKTYIAIRSIIEINKRALIIVPASLLNQWYEDLRAICDAEISLIRGNRSIYDLVKNNYETDAGIFVASVNTLQDYACGSQAYEVLPPMMDFIRDLKIGIKVVDECHLNFNANTLIDIQSINIQHNIYLSATYIRSSKASDNIFKKIYPDEIKFDNSKYDSYVNITECRYSLGQINPKYISTNRGYSQFKYEKLILRSQSKLNEFIRRILLPLVETYFSTIKNDNQKLLLLVGLRDFADMLTAWFRDTYPEFNTISYLHGTDDSELEDADVIISTLGSAGTGKDIKGLRTVILFTSFSSRALSLQSLGRLRKLPNDTPEFIYLVNTALESHKHHAKIKRDIYRSAGKTFNVIEI